MYAVVKTGGKQYTVKPGDVLAIEKLPAEIGDEVELPVIFVADGDKIEADPTKAASTQVIAKVLDQFKDKKKIVFKFKKRKGYKKLRGHRQQLTRVRILSVGSEKWEKLTDKAETEEKPAEAGPDEVQLDKPDEVQLDKVDKVELEKPEADKAESASDEE